MDGARIKHHKTGRFISLGWDDHHQYTERGDLFMALKLPLLGFENLEPVGRGPGGMYYSVSQLKNWHKRLADNDYKSEAKQVADFIEWMEYAIDTLRQHHEQYNITPMR